METIQVSELNNLSVNNPNANIRDISNYQTSDELNVGENNVLYGESKYARNKRISKTVINLTAFTTLLITAVASGSLIMNSFLGKAPVINNFESSYAIEGNIFKYNFDITIDKITLDMNVYHESTLIDSYPFKETGIYQGEINLTEKGDYIVKFISTNSFDFSQENSKYRINFSI